MVWNLQDGKIRTPANKGVSWNLEDGKLRSATQKEAAPAPAFTPRVMVY